MPLKAEKRSENLWLLVHTVLHDKGCSEFGHISASEVSALNSQETYSTVAYTRDFKLN
jgi:hypothetical protein